MTIYMNVNKMRVELSTLCFFVSYVSFVVMLKLVSYVDIGTTRNQYASFSFAYFSVFFADMLNFFYWLV